MKKNVYAKLRNKWPWRFERACKDSVVSKMFNDNLTLLSSLFTERILFFIMLFIVGIHIFRNMYKNIYTGKTRLLAVDFGTSIWRGNNYKSWQHCMNVYQIQYSARRVIAIRGAGSCSKWRWRDCSGMRHTLKSQQGSNLVDYSLGHLAMYFQLYNWKIWSKQYKKRFVNVHSRR